MRFRRLLVFAAVAAALTGCSTNPSTGRNQLILLSSESVAAMGDEAKPQVIAEFGGEVASAELRAYVNRVGHSLAAHVEPEYADIEWEFMTLNSDVINAFALPGGKVFITRGLLSKFSNEAQVAGVLGHEIGHVTARHIDERLSQTVAAQLGLAVLGAYSESDLVAAGGSLAAQGVLLKFGRDQESESDLQGLKYMTAAGYSPVGMRQVLDVLLEASRSGGSQPEFLSTHPHPETRIEDIDRLLAGSYSHTRDNPQYGLFPHRFEEGARPYLK